jgi:hypothetical protein
MTSYDSLTGPFASEQQFKQAIIRLWKSEDWMNDVLEVENEEKAPGMPDVLAFNNGRCTLYEFKLSDGNGVITFQKTQPLFYKQHPKLNTIILVWDAPRGRVAVLQPETILAAKSLRYKIPEETK